MTKISKSDQFLVDGFDPTSKKTCSHKVKPWGRCSWAWGTVVVFSKIMEQFNSLTQRPVLDIDSLVNITKGCQHIGEVFFFRWDPTEQALHPVVLLSRVRLGSDSHGHLDRHRVFEFSHCKQCHRRLDHWHCARTPKRTDPAGIPTSCVNRLRPNQFHLCWVHRSTLLYFQRVLWLDPGPVIMPASQWHFL